MDAEGGGFHGRPICSAPLPVMSERLYTFYLRRPGKEAARPSETPRGVKNRLCSEANLEMRRK